MKWSVKAVFNGSKILIWKQITTIRRPKSSAIRCIQWFKDTNLKANHNRIIQQRNSMIAVFNGSKILIWKQITTLGESLSFILSCIQWFKDTNLKANHNLIFQFFFLFFAVFNGSKILIWKQITTTFITLSTCRWLYSMVQRY